MAGSSSPITFGVELEFNVFKRAEDLQGYAEAISYFGKALAKETNLPIAGKCRCIGGQTCHGCASVPETYRQIARQMTVYGHPVRNHTQDKVYRGNAPYEYYFVMNENCAPAGRSDLVGMEISTPVRKADQIASGLPEIGSLIKALSELPCHIQIGKGTGLHIHVGSEAKLTLRLAQKVITLVAILEQPFLQAFQPQSRRDSSAQYAGPILSGARIVKNMAALGQIWQMAAMYKRERAQVDAHIPPTGRQNNTYWQKNGKEIETLLHGVWTAPKLSQLSQGIARNGIERLGFAIALRGDEPYENKESSFEFRYGDMTFDNAYIAMWVSVVSRIVELGHLDTAAFSSNVSGILQALSTWSQTRPEACFADILRALDFSPVQVQAWLPLIEEHRAGRDRFVDQSRRLIPQSS